MHPPRFDSWFAVLHAIPGLDVGGFAGGGQLRRPAVPPFPPSAKIEETARCKYEMSNVPSRTGVKVEPIFAGLYRDNPLLDTYTQRFRAFEKLKYALLSPGQHGIQMSTCAWRFPPVSNVRSVAHKNYLTVVVCAPNVKHTKGWHRSHPLRHVSVRRPGLAL